MVPSLNNVDRAVPRWRTVALALGAFVPLVAFWPVLVGGTETFYAQLDMSQAFYPFFQKEAIALHHGYLPLWDANIESGYSFPGDVGTAIFYPLNLLFVALFGTKTGISLWFLELLVVLHFWLAFGGMYLFARRLDFERPAAIVAALLFSYAGPHAYRAIDQESNFATASLIPFAAHFAACFARSGKKRDASLAGLTIGLEILGGHFAAPLFSLFVCLALLAGRVVVTRRPAGMVIGLVVIALGLLAVGAPQLFFGFLRFGDSYRFNARPELAQAMLHTTTAKIPFTSIDYYALPVMGLLSFFSYQYDAGNDLGNSLFMGTLPSAALILAFANRTVRTAFARTASPLVPLYVLGAVSAVIAIGGATPVGRIWYALPVVDTLVREPGRYTMIVAFAIATLVGHVITIGLHTFDGAGTARGLRSRFPAYLVVLPLVAFFAAFTTQPALPIVLSFLAAFAFDQTRRQRFAVSIVALCAFETTRVASAVPLAVSLPDYAATLWKNSPVYGPPERCYPACRVRLDNPNNRLPLNLGDVYPTQLTSGYTALADRTYSDFLAHGGSDDDFVNDLLNVRYVLSTRSRSGMRLVDEDPVRGFYLYERSTAFPRVFSLDAARARNRALDDVTFSIEHYDDLSEIFRVAVPRAETVVFSELFYPGWRFGVDGASVPPLVADVGLGPPIFRAVRLTRGDHLVTFSYPSLHFARASVTPPSPQR